MKLESSEPKTADASVEVSVNSEKVPTINLKTKTDGIWVIEASSNLKVWVDVNQVKTTNGEAETTDIRSLINEMRFYRARLLE